MKEKTTTLDGSIEGLSDDQVDELYATVEAEKEDRIKNPFYFFKPLPKQRRFINSQYRNKWLFGGNQSGKTTTGSWYVVDSCLKTPGTHWWCGAESKEISRIVQQKKIQEMLPWDEVEYGIYTEENGFTHNIVRFKNGSSISFRSYEQKRAKWQGATLDGIWFDEEPPWDIYQEGLARLVRKGGVIIGTMTALTGFTRLVDEVMRGRKKHIKTYFLSTYDNTYLSEENLLILKDSLDENDLESRLEGIPTIKTGLVFDGIRAEKPLMIPLDEEVDQSHKFRYIVSIDPHPKTPHAVLWMGVDPGGHVWVTKERGWLLKMDSMERCQWVSPRQLSIEIHEKNKGKHVEQTLIDKFMAKQGNAIINTNIQEQLLKEGLYTTEAGGEVESKIVITQQYMREGRLHIFESCWNLWWEMLRYMWEPHISERVADRKEEKQKPKKKNDHLIDCMMNGLMWIRQNEGTMFTLPTYSRNPEGRNRILESELHQEGPSYSDMENINIMDQYS